MLLYFCFDGSLYYKYSFRNGISDFFLISKLVNNCFFKNFRILVTFWALISFSSPHPVFEAARMVVMFWVAFKERNSVSWIKFL